MHLPDCDTILNLLEPPGLAFERDTLLKAMVGTRLDSSANIAQAR